MEESAYQKLGPRTLVYGIITRSKTTLVLMLLTLGLELIRTYLIASTPETRLGNILDTMIYWGVVATVAVLVISTFVSWLEYTMFTFRMDTDIFKIRRGVFTKVETAIPYRRIESVDIKRTLIHQLFGVSRIAIETTIDNEATSDNKSNSDDEVFPVIDHHLAQMIQEEIAKRANVQKMKM